MIDAEGLVDTAGQLPGTFHRDQRIVADDGGTILVLPEWKESRRHLEALPNGELRFVDSDY